MERCVSERTRLPAGYVRAHAPTHTEIGLALRRQRDQGDEGRPAPRRESPVLLPYRGYYSTCAGHFSTWKTTRFPLILRGRRIIASWGALLSIYLPRNQILEFGRFSLILMHCHWWTCNLFSLWWGRQGAKVTVCVFRTVTLKFSRIFKNVYTIVNLD